MERVRGAHSWTIETIDQDPTGFTNLRISVDVDSVGIPHVAYSLLHPVAALKYGVRLPSGWKIEVVQSGNGGADASLKLDGLGQPHIAFLGGSAGSESLSYASKVGASWAVEVVDGESGCGRYASLGFDVGGRPHLAYLCPSGAPSPGTLRHAWWDGTSWNNETVATGAADPSLAFDASGRPTIAYAVPNSLQVRRAYFDGTTWRSEIVEGNAVLDDRGTSIARDRSGILHISYMESVSGQLRYASPGPLAWGVEVVDTPVTRFCGYNHESSLVFNQSNAPQIAYRTCKPGSHDIQLAAKEMTTGNWSLEYVAAGGVPSLALDPYDNPHIGFLAYSQGLVRYAFVPPTDSAPPSSRVLPLAPYWHMAGPVTVNATASDGETAVVEVTLFYSFAQDNATWGAWSAFATDGSPPWSWGFSFPDGGGHYRFFSIAVDLAGNRESAKSVAEAIAGYRIPPDFALEDPRPASPAVIGPGLTLNLSVTVRNHGGDANATSTLAFCNESTPGSPFASFLVPALPASEVQPVTASWLSPTALGSYAVTAAADYTDVLAESSETNNGFTWTIRVVAGPVTSLIVGAPNATLSVAYVTSATPLGFAAVDRGGTGIRRTDYRVDNGTWVNYTATGTFALTAEGEHFLEWFSEDYAGNVEGVRSGILRVDDTPPTTIPAIGDPKYLVGGTFVTSATLFALTALDGGIEAVGVDVTEYRIGAGPWTRYTAPFAIPGEGVHPFAFRSADLLGNAEPIQVLQITVDDTPPVTTLAVGAPNVTAADRYVTSSTPVSLVALDGGANPVGVAATEVQIDAGPWAPYEGPFFLTGEGHHTVGFRSADRLANAEAVRSSNLVVDDTPPTVVLGVGMPRHDGTDRYVTSATPLTATAVDGGPVPVGLASVECRGGGGPWTPYAGPLTLAAPDGMKAIECRATDLLGNAAAGQLVVVLDDTPPTTTASRGDGTYPTGTTFELAAADAGSGVAASTYSVDGGPWLVYAGPFTLAEGAHAIRYYSTDRLNNTEAEHTLSVTIEGAPPPPPRETNWKPLVAAIFAAVLAIAGVWSARRAPPMAGSRSRLRAFVLTSLPFVALEAGTGVASLVTGLLAIPPLAGVGIAVDVGILVAGVAVSAYRIRT